MDGFILNIVLAIVPAGIVFATSYLLIKRFLDAEAEKRETEVRNTNQAIITPLRLQACERLALFLERSNLSSLVMRVNKNGMSANLLRAELIKTIRSEFEHNLSQQIYIAPQTWDMIKNAQEEVIKTINIAATKVPETASSVDLAQVILQIASSVDKLPTELALDLLKRDISRIF